MEIHRYDDLWTAIVSERARQRMTAAELARRSGIPKGTIDQYLSGRVTPTYPRVIALADALGIDVQASVTGGIATNQDTSGELVGAAA